MSQSPNILFTLSCALIAACSPTHTQGANPPPLPASNTLAPDGLAQRVPDTTRNSSNPNDSSPAGMQRERTSGSHCKADERVLFSCRIERSTKTVSMCASGTASGRGGHVYYAFGALGQPELVYPVNGAGSGDAFRRTQLTYGGGSGGYAYSFENGGSTYIVYSVSGDAGLERQGVMVANAEASHALLDMLCGPDIVESDDLDLLRQVRNWPAHERLARHGLPPAAR